MSKGRIILIAAGLLITAGAFFLILRGGGGAAAAVPEPAAPGAVSGGKAKEEDKAPPRWQSFIRPGERDTPPRPVLRVARELPSPFDRLPVAAPPRQAVSVVREDPGLQLQGISTGAQTVALVSGQAVRVGDTVSGYRVVGIGRSAVTLAGPQGARFDLSLRKYGPESGGGR